VEDSSSSLARHPSLDWKMRRRTTTARWGLRIFSSWWSLTWLVRTRLAHSWSDVDSGGGSGVVGDGLGLVVGASVQTGVWRAGACRDGGAFTTDELFVLMRELRMRLK